MKAFYMPFDMVFTRSRVYVPAVEELGVDAERVRPLLPGVDTKAFLPSTIDPGFWRSLGVKPADVNVLYVGRVSREKNMALLARVWRLAHSRLSQEGVEASLIVVGERAVPGGAGEGAQGDQIAVHRVHPRRRPDGRVRRPATCCSSHPPRTRSDRSCSKPWRAPRRRW